MSLLRCVLGAFWLSVQVHGKPLPTRGSHNMDVSFPQLIFHKYLYFFSFLPQQWVHLSLFWHKPLFQFYSIVPGLLHWHPFWLLFSKHPFPLPKPLGYQSFQCFFVFIFFHLLYFLLFPFLLFSSIYRWTTWHFYFPFFPIYLWVMGC